MLRVPDPLRDAHQRDRQLRQSIKRLVNHFRELGNVRFMMNRGYAISFIPTSPVR